MAISATDALLGDTVEGSVDYRGRLVTRSSSGGWRSAFFIIVEMAERFAYYGIGSNLISYLTGPLQQSTAAAAANVNAWSGAASMLPLLGAFVADSYLGRYRTILYASLLYILGLGLLTLSALLPSLRPPDCERKMETSSCASPTPFQILFFFFSLYLVALAQGGHKPCVQAFGADQFDPRDPKESKSKSSFFNWWYFALCAGTVVSLWIVTYIQDNLSWGLGFGIPCISMALALVVFLLGTRTYRYSLAEEKSTLVRILQVFVAAARNRQAHTSTADKTHLPPIGAEARETGCTTQFKFLDRAAASTDGLDCSKNSWSVCSVSQVEEAKGVLQLFPIWVTCLIYAVVFAQSSTFFTKQGSTMERWIGSGFQIPAATLQTFISLSIVIVIPMYDRIFVPIVRSFTGLPSGITMLKRIGIGMFLSVVSMAVAAVVEAQRLIVARDAGLVDVPAATVPMSVWWLAPQYILFGVADVFTMVGLQEFFYDQVPDGLRSLGLSLYLSIFGVGSFLSSFLIAVIEKATSGPGRESWFSNNLNKGHLDYFYWLLAGFSAVELVIYSFFANSYLYKNKRRNATM
ncbi:protein NRT1/ PTR FAMILY 5.10-like isoform X2 [Magnolia sinica]|uniref:protein NRT1/ PTR FAMILY 5.10-like isoform X2 n=1 Tax=Magnolia sinica TaxID=86752 RepID=UPI002659870F|nr:protein NRT1/ PTR FAMILY 5.10-like isoform X2 [Magnolia sinica]